MGSLYYNNSKFIYEGQGGESQILLDCGCYLANKSRVPMHRLPGMEYLTIPDLLLGLLEKEKGHGEDLEFSAALLDILLASRLIKISSPGKCAGIRLCKWKPEPSSGGGFRDISRGVGSCLCL